MIKFEKIKPGMILYDVRKDRSVWRGNGWVHFRVEVLEVDAKNRKVLASWNSNAPQWMFERDVTKYRANLPK